MKYVRLLALIFVVVAGCTVTDPTDGPDRPDDDTASNDVDDSETDDSTPTPDAGNDTVEPDLPPPVFGDIPDAIDSTGARFAGALPANSEVRIDLTVFQADRVTMWLRQANDTSWDASISVFQKGESDSLVWGNPRGNEDAHIPYRDEELSDGFEFWFTGTYDLALENRGPTDGEFEFTLDCRGGPCAIDSGDADLDGIPDDSDPCPYYPGDACENPYTQSDDALEDAIRADHAEHVTLNYVEGRVHMFAWIDNEAGEVEGVYTGERVETVEIPDPTVMNTEHTWPQSRSGGDPATESDLHHLYPTISAANDERGSLRFGEVVSTSWERGGSRVGDDASGNTVFEPRDEHKGRVARALFYYAVIYGQEIPASEESVLRRWHDDHRADEAEKRRNQAIANVQGSRNPFVDFGELVDQVSDF